MGYRKTFTGKKTWKDQRRSFIYTNQKDRHAMNATAKRDIRLWMRVGFVGHGVVARWARRYDS
jgi:hypothetical protein